ncbi:MAG: condensation domain-containing protein, partial [Verrucomicrobiota bacterium]
MPDLTQKIAALSPEKRALLEARLLKKNNPVAQIIIPETLQNHLPELSFAQQSLWFLDSLEPNSAFYSIPQAIQISGSLDAEALRKSFEKVIERHEVLRTQILPSGGKPEARLIEKGAFPLPIVDLSHLGILEQQAEGKRLIEIEVQKPFDLENDLMLRATLLRFSPVEHFLLLTVHHIASDHWSFAVLYRELKACYQSCQKGELVTLPPLPIQYSDVARAQREFFQSEKFLKQVAYWKQHLAGELTELELPLDHPRPARQSFRGARKFVSLPHELAVQIKSFCQREGTTPYVILLAAFQVLLHRISGQSEIIIGSPIGGRYQLEAEQLIGYFVNPLVLRTDLSGDPTFLEALHRVREVVFGAFSNQEIPFEKVVDELRVPRDSGKNPIFQTIFQFQTQTPKLELPGTKTKLLPVEIQTSKLDLVFTMAETEEGFSGDMEYNTDIFEGETVERMLGQYGCLLGSILARPEEKISRLQILGEAEREKVL